MSAQRIYDTPSERLAWQDKAACKGPEATRIFFPPSLPERKDEKDDREAKAKAVCGACAVRAACLDHAIAIREGHGIWGGKNETERKILATRRAG